MFEVNEISNGRRVKYDLHNLQLPNGAWAHRLPHEKLYEQLSALGIPGLDCHDGVQTLLLKYARHLHGPEPVTPQTLEEQRAALEAERAAFERHREGQNRLLQEDREALLKRLRAFDKERAEFAERAK